MKTISWSSIQNCKKVAELWDTLNDQKPYRLIKSYH